MSHNTQPRRVVITGIGIVSPLGNNAPTTWQRLLKKESGIDFIKKFDASSFKTKIGAEVKDFRIKQDSRYSNILKNTHGFSHFALSACEEALDDAQLMPSKESGDRWGLIAGSAGLVVSYEYLYHLQQHFAPEGIVDWKHWSEYGMQYFSEQEFHDLHFNHTVSSLAELFNIHGSVLNVNTACASGGQAIGLACQAIKRGQVDYVLAGGFDSMLNVIGLAKFSLIGAMTENNAEPSKASRPFDQNRSGFVLGEGAAFLMLEEYSSAVKRNAKIYAELLGDGNTLSCYRITDSPRNGDGASYAIEQAINASGLVPENIDYINAHGTSTKMNDLSETNAIKRVFKDSAYQLRISSTKSQVGHLISAAGAIEAAFCALGLYYQVMPGTINLDSPDPECDLNYCPNQLIEGEFNCMLSHSFGFGGTNNVLALRRVEHG